MSLAPEHPLALNLSKGTPQEEAVRCFVEKTKRQDWRKRTAETAEKEGVFTGAYCLNPMTGARMPIFVANFVLMGYGTGAVMAVPTHDQRDFEFAKKYDLPLIVVIQPNGQLLEEKTMTGAYEGRGPWSSRASSTEWRAPRQGKPLPNTLRSRPGREENQLSFEGLGDLAATATGEHRFPSLVVTGANCPRS